MKAVIGIDQSYTDTGIAVMTKGKVRNAISVPLLSFENDTDRRDELRERLTDVLDKCIDNGYTEITGYIEQVRINAGRTTFEYMKRAGAMEALIIDTFHKYRRMCTEASLYAHMGIHISLYSVSTIAWKTQVLGGRDSIQNTFGIDPAKYATFKFCHARRYGQYVLQKASKQTRNFVYQDKNGDKWKYNDNIGDAICIAMYDNVSEELSTRKELI